MKIAIIGAGEIGSAIFSLISDKDYDIKMWDKDPSKVSGGATLEETIELADVIFLCIPSRFVRELLNEIKPLNIDKSIIVGVSKGMEKDTQMTNIEIFKDVLGIQRQKLAIISGPMLAEELSNGKIGAATIASEDKLALEVLSDLFSKTRLKITGTDQVLEVAQCGILKNIYAILLGAMDGLDYGYNAKGWFMTNAVKEMLLICGSATLSYAGIGDLIATGSGTYSKNYSFGMESAKNGKSDIDCEGKISIPGFFDKLGDKAKNYPLFMAAKNIAVDGLDAREVLDKLIYSEL